MPSWDKQTAPLTKCSSKLLQVEGVGLLQMGPCSPHKACCWQWFSCWFCLTPVTAWAEFHQALLSEGFSRQEHWSGLPFPLPGDPPDPGIELLSLTSAASVGGSFTASAAREDLLLPGLLSSGCFSAWLYIFSISLSFQDSTLVRFLKPDFTL